MRVLGLLDWGMEGCLGWLTIRYASFRNSSAVLWAGLGRDEPCLESRLLSVGVRSVMAGLCMDGWRCVFCTVAQRHCADGRSRIPQYYYKVLTDYSVRGFALI